MSVISILLLYVIVFFLLSFIKFCVETPIHLLRPRWRALLYSTPWIILLPCFFFGVFTKTMFCSWFAPSWLAGWFISEVLIGLRVRSIV